jgi:cysteinyl-tRNA synthetase
MHNGFVEVGGEKMSKSLGNFTNLLDLTDRHDPRAYRVLVLRSHYRSPVEVTATTIADAERQLDRLDAFARRTADLAAAPPDPEALVEFRRLMDDDLNTPGALALVSQLVTRTNQALDIEDVEEAAGLATAAKELCGAFGLQLRAGEGEGPDGAVLGLVSQRAEAKAARDFAAADGLRDEIKARGWLVEDTAKGPVLRRV